MNMPSLRTKETYEELDSPVVCLEDSSRAGVAATEESKQECNTETKFSNVCCIESRD